MGDAAGIDPITWRLIGVNGNQLYEDAEIIQWAAKCPACGNPTTVDRIFVGTTDQWLIGHWRCTRHIKHTSAPPIPR